jgi:hypothetical protein
VRCIAIKLLLVPGDKILMLLENASGFFNEASTPTL